MCVGHGAARGAEAPGQAACGELQIPAWVGVFDHQQQRMRNEDSKGDAEGPGGWRPAEVTAEVAGLHTTCRLACLGIVSGTGSRLF